MDIACLSVQYVGITNFLFLKRRASILLEGNGEEYTEIAIRCQDYFRNFIEEIIAVLDYGMVPALTICHIILPI